MSTACACHACVTNIRPGSLIFLPEFACEFAMLLLLTLVVYLFHGFQTHAAPLTTVTSHLAERSSNASLLDTQACICPTIDRSIWDILWSCLATIFACSWVSIHPNIPGPNESWWRIFLRRLELMFWAVVGPEMIICWAFRQWLGARKLKKLYKGELSSLIHIFICKY